MTLIVLQLVIFLLPILSWRIPQELKNKRLHPAKAGHGAMSNRMLGATGRSRSSSSSSIESAHVLIDLLPKENQKLASFCLNT
jgi:hypothetical protein